jgi:hypothetical protein
MSDTVSLNPFGPIRDPKVRAVIQRLHTTRRFPQNSGPREQNRPRPADFAEYGFSIHPDQGDLIYLLCRGMKARRVVDFATSIGMSTLDFAAAIRDNDGGLVIGSELVPAKVEVARQNLSDAGLAEYVDIRAAMRAKRCAIWAVPSISRSSTDGRCPRSRRSPARSSRSSRRNCASAATC